MAVDIETISAQLDCQQYSDVLGAQLPKLTYSNHCVWPAGLAKTHAVYGL